MANDDRRDGIRRRCRNPVRIFIRPSAFGHAGRGMVIAMDNTDTQTRAKLVRGLMWSAPLAIALWGMLALAALAVVPHTVRHAIHADARYTVHVLKRDLGWRPPASGLTRAG